MRWFITILLAAGVVVGTAGLALESRIRTWARPPVAVGATVSRLNDLRDAGAIRSLTLTRDGQAPLTITRNADGTWSQPGNWPLRESEVAVLTNALAGLQPRFAPLPYDAENAAKYGLSAEQKPVALSLEAKSETVTRTIKLTLGRPEQTDGGDFSQACFLRVDEENEVVQLGAEAYDLLARSPEVYRRRQLVTDVERIKLPAEGSERSGRSPLLGDAFTSVTLENNGTKVSFTRIGKTPEARRDPDRPNAEPTLSLDRLAQSWDVRTDGPTGFIDRPDPAKLKSILTAVADLWAEGFVPVADATVAKTGLDKPAKSIALGRTDGKPLTLVIGNVIRTSLKLEDAPKPMFPGAPPAPPKAVSEEYRAAQIVGNDLVFELRTDKLNDLFPANLEELRDARLARWDTAEVQSVVVALKGKPATTVTRKPGVKDADKDEDRQDRWYVGDRLAESAKVTELLDALSKLEAKAKDEFTDNPDAAKLTAAGIDVAAGTKISITVQPRSATGDAALPPRTISYTVGNDDATKKKLALLVAGRERLNFVDDAVFKFIDRPALAYRSRKLIDTAGLTLDALAVTREGEAFALALAKKEKPADADAWNFTAPIAAPADAGKVTPFAEKFTKLEVIDYLEEAPTPEDLDKKYGLAKPRFTVNLGFAGPNAAPQVLTVGVAREGKPEAYARLNNGNVFSIAKAVPDALEAGAVALLAPQLWSIPDGKLKSVTVTRDKNPPYTLTETAGAWALAGPFSAVLPKATIDPTIIGLRVVNVAKYETLAAKNLADFGLDQPYLRIALTAEEGAAPLIRTLLVGKVTADGARFAKLEGDKTPAIFTLPAATIQLLDVAPLDRLDKNLLALDPAKIASLTLNAAKPADAVKLVRTGTDWKVDGQTFAVDGPTIQALAFIAGKPPTTRLAAYGDQTKWADYGLDAPTTISVELTSTPPETPVKHVIKLGKTEANGERYVRIDDGLAVGVLPARAAETLAKTKLDFVDRGLLKFDPIEFQGLTRITGKDVLELALAGTTWEVVKPAKLKADAAVVEDLAAILSQLRVDKVAAFAPKDAAAEFGLNDTAAVFTIKFKAAGKDETRTLKLGKPVDAAKPDGDRYASVDPQVVGVLPAMVVKKLTGSPLKYRDRALAKFVDADVIQLERGDRKATFAKIDGTWKQTKPIEGEAEQADLDDLVNVLAVLKADELVAEKPADLTPFGLKAPEAKWTLLAGEKPVLTLLVGSSEATGSRVHAMLDKGELVALLDPTLSAKVRGEYRKRAVWKNADAAQADSIAISGTTGNKVYKKTPTGWIDAAKPTEVLPPATVTTLLAAFAGLKAERWVAEAKPDLALYGLVKPNRVIVVTQAGTSFTLKIGGPEGSSNGKKRYAQADGTDAVFLLSEADTATLGK